MNFLPLFFLLCLACFIEASPTTSTTTPTPKKARTVDKETSYVPKEPVNSPTNFGFVPVKTADNYIQKEPLGRYVYPDLLGQTQAFISKYPSYEKPQQTYKLQLAQYNQQQPLSSYNTAQTHAVQYVYPHQYVQQQIQPAQDYSTSFEYQLSQPQISQYYQEPANKGGNYYSANVAPQYVHFQQPSNLIENVIGPKDQGVRFIMFIPSYVPQQSAVQNYYVPQQQAATQEYTTATVNHQPQQVQYVYRTEPSPSPQKASSYEKEPTSLLDSYVPSVLQLQYYKKLQAQSQQNQIVSNDKQTSHNSKKSNDKYER